MSNLSSLLSHFATQTLNDCTSEQAHSGFICHLTELGLMRFSGEDAASFLHGQLTNEMLKFPSNQARLAAYCNPKGRILGSFLCWKNGEDIILQCAKDLQAGLQKRLQMFIMRAKVKVNDETPNTICLGLGGQQAQSVLTQFFPQILELDTPYSSQENQYGRLIRVHDGYSNARYQWIVPQEIAKDIASDTFHGITWCNSLTYQRAEILAGIAHITAATYEKFVPQMINYEVVGAVNFRKGCYPGQEIVARSQYLGKLKRRMAIAKIAHIHVSAGMEIFSKEDPNQPCGMVVNSQIDFNTQHSLCLLEIKIADQQDGQVYLAEQAEQVFEFLPLPYAIIDVTE